MRLRIKPIPKQLTFIPTALSTLVSNMVSFQVSMIWLIPSSTTHSILHCRPVSHTVETLQRQDKLEIAQYSQQMHITRSSYALQSAWLMSTMG